MMYVLPQLTHVARGELDTSLDHRDQWRVAKAGTPSYRYELDGLAK